MRRPSSELRTSWKKVDAFRLARHHLSERLPSRSVVVSVRDIAGAQAQVLTAAQISAWARVEGTRALDLDSAMWKDRSLVRAWCMRRTMFLLAAEDLSLFARGSTRCAGYGMRRARSLVSSTEALDRLLDAVSASLSGPKTRSELASSLRESGYGLKAKAGGGWGSTRSVQWVETKGLSLPVGYLLHLMGTREVLCCGPNRGNESTYVRADRWVPSWKDIPVDLAERRMLVRYLRAYGPATVNDFALWAGMYVRDAKEIWSRESENISTVDIDGWAAGILASDLPDLKDAEVGTGSVRLLPYFDSFLLGHKSHRNVVDATNHARVYRSQGWVSPVLLLNGRAAGVWSHSRRDGRLDVTISAFSRLPGAVARSAKEEASDLGRFLGCSDVTTVFS